ncbi:MAG TPA: adenosylmethionine--8-amino-7-oxononanoate transaminase, partial [Chthoniobacteraceae bacterium]
MSSSSLNSSEIVELDRRFVWHPFTQMRDWMAGADEPTVIVEGEGALLRDSQGKTYFDGNSSIWTNLHGHRRPEIDAALRAQLDRIAHSSFLGLTNEVAPRLAAELAKRLLWEGAKVFFSDDGSTAMEAGLKMLHQARAQRGETERKVYVSLSSGYHGDTVGAMSLGHSGIFHHPYRGLMFASREVMSPACYRCPYNRAKPQRGADARATRECGWECVKEVERTLDELGEQATAFVLEPRVQGAGSMAMHPPGYLARVSALCRERGVWLFLDEVLTGFGRTGAMFAFQKEEGVQPDVVALAKGLSGGYLPLAATVASQEIFAAFLGEYADFKTFFHGHSYSGNALGCAAARANLQLFETVHTLEHIQGRAAKLAELVQGLWEHPNVGDIRCEGTICAIELVEDFATRRPFPAERRVGWKVCEAAKKHGLLTRPIGDVIVLMPPYCATDEQLASAVEA